MKSGIQAIQIRTFLTFLALKIHSQNIYVYIYMCMYLLIHLAISTSIQIFIQIYVIRTGNLYMHASMQIINKLTHKKHDAY